MEKHFQPSATAAWTMVVSGIVGLLASVVLTVERFALLQQEVDVANGRIDEVSDLACDLSRWASCSGVMESDQAAAFGFPNPVLGVIGFAVLLTLGVLYVARASLPRWAWAGVQVGATLSIVFVTWLQIEAVFVIGLLCVYCVAVWIVAIPLFVVVTQQSLRLWLPNSGATRFLGNWTLLVVLLWYVAVASLVVFEFGSSVLS